jgi:hypothetical protein
MSHTAEFPLTRSVCAALRRIIFMKTFTKCSNMILWTEMFIWIRFKQCAQSPMLFVPHILTWGCMMNTFFDCMTP